MTAGRPRRSAARWSPSSAMPTDGIDRRRAASRHRAAPRSVDRPRPRRPRRRSRCARSRSSADRAWWPSARTGSASPRRGAGRRGRRPAARRARGRRAAAPGPADGRRRRRRGRRRPAMMPGLRAAEQLVAAERHERGAGGERLAGGRLAGQPRRRAAGEPRAGGVEQARADVGHDRHAERRPARRPATCLDEAVDPVVRRVHLEHERDVGAGRAIARCVVGEAGAVGGADVDQPGAGLLHHLGHAEAAADLDALAPADERRRGPRPARRARAARRRRCC